MGFVALALLFLRAYSLGGASARGLTRRVGRYLIHGALGSEMTKPVHLEPVLDFERGVVVQEAERYRSATTKLLLAGWLDAFVRVHRDPSAQGPRRSL
jgi:hypothetical protein